MQVFREMDSGGQSKLSFSRILPFAYIALLTVAWIGIGIWIVVLGLDDGSRVWGAVGDWLTWGRELAFVTVLPYLGNQVKQLGR